MSRRYRTTLTFPPCSATTCHHGVVQMARRATTADVDCWACAALVRAPLTTDGNLVPMFRCGWCGALNEGGGGGARAARGALAAAWHWWATFYREFWGRRGMGGDRAACRGDGRVGAPWVPGTAARLLAGVVGGAHGCCVGLTSFPPPTLSFPGS